MVQADDTERARLAFDAEWSRIYRQHDEIAISLAGAYRHYGGIVEQLSTAFGRTITALDLGCGTGRYFHCLRNVDRLMAVDVSEHMLEEARKPVFPDRITVGAIELVAGHIFSPVLDDRQFDFIYSVGVLGEYTPVTAELLQRLHGMLRPGGVAFFTSTDSRSRVSVPENARASFARRALRKSFPLLPNPVRVLLNGYFSPNYITPVHLRRLLQQSPFARFTLEPYTHPSGWQGTNLDCTAWREDQQR